MKSIFAGRALLPAVGALRAEHDEIRAELVRATLEQGPIAEAARVLARLCVPHFEEEEKQVFPVLELLPTLAAGHVQPEMASVLPLVSRLAAPGGELRASHDAVLEAIGSLLHAAQEAHNREFADFSYHLWLHEKREEEVIFPMVILIGNYVRERLGIRTDRDDSSPTASFAAIIRAPLSAGQ